MAPAEDFAWDVGELHDSFSLSNMAPQLPGLNRQGWERLEEYVRAWAWARKLVIVYVGPVITSGEASIGKDDVTVPTAFWKVIVDPSHGEAIAFVMPQKPVAKGKVGSSFEKSIGEIERAARVRLPLPGAIDRAAISPFWVADLSGFRKRHKEICSD